MRSFNMLFRYGLPVSAWPAQRQLTFRVPVSCGVCGDNVTLCTATRLPPARSAAAPFHLGTSQRENFCARLGQFGIAGPARRRRSSPLLMSRHTGRTKPKVNCERRSTLANHPSRSGDSRLAQAVFRPFLRPNAGKNRFSGTNATKQSFVWVRCTRRKSDISESNPQTS